VDVVGLLLGSWEACTVVSAREQGVGSGRAGVPPAGAIRGGGAGTGYCPMGMMRARRNSAAVARGGAARRKTWAEIEDPHQRRACRPPVLCGSRTMSGGRPPGRPCLAHWQKARLGVQPSSGGPGPYLRAGISLRGRRIGRRGENKKEFGSTRIYPAHAPRGEAMFKNTVF